MLLSYNLTTISIVYWALRELITLDKHANLLIKLCQDKYNKYMCENEMLMIFTKSHYLRKLFPLDKGNTNYYQHISFDNRFYVQISKFNKC